MPPRETVYELNLRLLLLPFLLEERRRPARPLRCLAILLSFKVVWVDD